MKNRNSRTRGRSEKEQTVQVIPLGGVGEIGKNMTLIRYRDEMLLIDCGMTFPSDEMYGIDIVIPDMSYLVENAEKLRGVVITHGHEDHIGGVPYLLKKLSVPIYGTALTLGLIQNKLNEHLLKGDLRTIVPGDRLQIGSFRIEVLNITHSIAGACAFAIDTPAGLVFHTGDFKIDYTPLKGDPIDFQRFAEIGRKGVLLLLADSTNAERKGYTPSERTVAATLDSIFATSKGRIIIATFASNVNRVQYIMNLAHEMKKKVAVSGRSMINMVNIASELGYLDVPDNTLIELNRINTFRDSEVVMITTGSQGEPMSALTRMASDDHKNVKIKPGDTVVLSSSPIPGNEKTISNVVNKLLEKGAKVIYSAIADIHVSGHPCQEELKILHTLLRPNFFAPVHGEFKHLHSHAEVARSLGMPKENIFIMHNGSVLNVSQSRAELEKKDVPAGSVMVDGLGVGDVGKIVLRDRKLLSESGLIVVVTAVERGSNYIVSGPEIISRGFVYVRESEDLLNTAKMIVTQAIEDAIDRGLTDWPSMKNAVRDSLRDFVFEQTKRNPIILPIFMEV